MFLKTQFEKEKAPALSDTEASSRFAGLGSFAIFAFIPEIAIQRKGVKEEISTAGGAPIIRRPL
jgi:hypothetical protein